MSGPRKLCYVVPELDPDTDTHFAHTGRQLAALAAAVTLRVIVQHAGGPVSVAAAEHVAVQTARRRALRLLQLVAFLVAARWSGYRDLYVHYSYSAAIAGALLARATGARVSYWHCGQSRQFYGGWGWSRASLAKKLGDEWPFRLSLRLVHRLVTGTPTMAAYYAREFGVPAARTAVVPNDIDLARFAVAEDRATARRHLGLGVEQPVVLFVHRLSPRKGVLHLVPIAERIRSAAEGVVLLVAGAGPLEGWLRQEVATRGLGDAVRVLGAVPNRALPRYYAAADVFLMPSEEEGFPRVLLEAQAMGVPFVAADVGGVRDVVTPRQAEWVVERGKVDAFADAVVRLLHDPPLRARLADEGRANVARFDTGRVTGQLLDVLFPPPGGAR